MPEFSLKYDFFLSKGEKYNNFWLKVWLLYDLCDLYDLVDTRRPECSFDVEEAAGKRREIWINHLKYNTYFDFKRVSNFWKSDVKKTKNQNLNC